MKASQHLVIFARRPGFGVGKRRLAAEAGDLVALRFQREALATLFRRLCRHPQWTTWVAVTPDRPCDWIPSVAASMPQGAGDLGMRLSRVARRIPRGSVVIIGSDTPVVRADDIVEAFRRLGSADAVLGPTPDGGYWLVGLKQQLRQIDPFGAVRWSTPHALTDTLRNLANQRVAILRSLEDVDDLGALRRFQNRCKRLAP